MHACIDELQNFIIVEKWYKILVKNIIGIKKSKFLLNANNKLPTSLFFFAAIVDFLPRHFFLIYCAIITKRMHCSVDYSAIYRITLTNRLRKVLFLYFVINCYSKEKFINSHKRIILDIFHTTIDHSSLYRLSHWHYIIHWYIWLIYKCIPLTLLHCSLFKFLLVVFLSNLLFI